MMLVMNYRRVAILTCSAWLPIVLLYRSTSVHTCRGFAILECSVRHGCRSTRRGTQTSALRILSSHVRQCTLQEMVCPKSKLEYQRCSQKKAFGTKLRQQCPKAKVWDLVVSLVAACSSQSQLLGFSGVYPRCPKASFGENNNLGPHHCVRPNQGAVETPSVIRSSAALHGRPALELPSTHASAFARARNIASCSGLLAWLRPTRCSIEDVVRSRGHGVRVMAQLRPAELSCVSKFF